MRGLRVLIVNTMVTSNVKLMPVSRRELIKGIAMVAQILLPIEANAVDQNSAPIPENAETESFLKLFEEAWRPLNPQVRLVLRLIYGGLRGLPPPSQLSVAELRR